MSPLARSLLVLAAALVATGHAQPSRKGDKLCFTKNAGFTGDYEPIVLPTVTATCPEDNVEAQPNNLCKRQDPYSHGCGLHIVICNKSPGGQYPGVGDVDPRILTPIPVHCYDEVGADVTVSIKCCQT